jgi:hypothetical protein
MRLFRIGALALILGMPPALATAQDPSGRLNEGPADQPPASMQTGRDNLAPPGATPSPSIVGDPQAAAEGPLGATGQTVPAKQSDSVAAADAVPVMARAIPLTEEQRQQIYKSVMATGTPASVNAKPADELPANVELSELPQEITDAIPLVRGLKSVRTGDKVLLVSPPNRIVVGEIEK